MTDRHLQRLLPRHLFEQHSLFALHEAPLGSHMGSPQSGSLRSVNPSQSLSKPSLQLSSGFSVIVHPQSGSRASVNPSQSLSCPSLQDSSEGSVGVQVTSPLHLRFPRPPLQLPEQHSLAVEQASPVGVQAVWQSGSPLSTRSSQSLSMPSMQLSSGPPRLQSIRVI